MYVNDGFDEDRIKINATESSVEKIKLHLCKNFEKIYEFCHSGFKNSFSLEISKLSVETINVFLKEKRLSNVFKFILNGILIPALGSHSLIVAKSLEGMSEIFEYETIFPFISIKLCGRICDKILEIWEHKNSKQENLEYVKKLFYLKIKYFRKFTNFW